MPKVSVIVPVKNGEAYLAQCLDSLLAQSLEDFELLCVDDGSTDSSSSILHAYAKRDERMRVVESGENRGAGHARNVALGLACGDYLSFLDADDLFEPDLLAHVYLRAVEDNADVTLYRARYLDQYTGAVSPAEGLLKRSLLPPVRPFSRHDIPDAILLISSPAPWNKMFRREFVRAAALRFQEIPRANDYCFTKLALALAERISVVDEVLVSYRLGSSSSLQSGIDETPLVFADAHRALMLGLLQSGTHAEVERSFVNAVLGNSLYNLRSMKSREAFEAVYRFLKEEHFSAMGIRGRDESYFMNRREYDEYVAIEEHSPEEYVFKRLLDTRSELARLRTKLSTAEKDLASANGELARMSGSRSYRAARTLGFLRRRLAGSAESEERG